MRFSEHYKQAINESVITEASIYKPDKIGMKYVLSDIGHKVKSLSKYGDEIFERIPDGNYKKMIDIVGSAKGKQAYFKGKNGDIYNFDKVGETNFNEYKGEATTGKGKQLSGAEYEKLITYYHNKKLKVNELDSQKYADLFGTPAKEKLFDTIKEPYFKELGTKFAKQTVTLLKEPLTQTGSMTVETSNFWKGFDAKDKTPKTDIMAVSQSSKFSVKKSGGSQLCSAIRAESTATLNASIDALSKLKNGADPKSIKMIKQFTNPKKWSSVTDPNKNISSVKKLYPPALKKEMGKRIESRDYKKIKTEFSKIKGEYEEAVLKGILSNRDLEKTLSKIMENDADLKYQFTKEAMTGNYKFGESSAAAANEMLVFDTNGKVKILRIDKKLISIYADKVKFQVNWKTSGKRSQTAIRVSTDGDPTLTATLNDSVILATESVFNEFNETLNEGILGDIMTKVKDGLSFVSQMITKILSKVTDMMIAAARAGYKALMRFLGLEAESTLNTNPTITL